MHHGGVSPQIAQGLLALKKRIAAAKIPPSKLTETINVSIWNISEFCKVRRTESAIYYIAEVLGQFDLVTLVELRNYLTDLGRVLPIWGPSWDVVYSDWIEDAGRNKEDADFLFDSWHGRYIPNLNMQRRFSIRLEHNVEEPFRQSDDSTQICPNVASKNDRPSLD